MSHSIEVQPVVYSALVTVKVSDSATIQSDDSMGDSSGKLGSDPESTESTPELNQSILGCCSSHT